ncbi:MAG: hypothetical protein U0570_15655 [Phycisphaerales bacterium]
MNRWLTASLAVAIPTLVAAQQPEVPFEKTVETYRAGPIAESVQIRVKDSAGHERRADATVVLDAGGNGRPWRGKVELGDLSFSIEGSRLIATHRLEKNRYAEFTLADKPLLEALEAVMPALILPQLVLADPRTNQLANLGLLGRGARFTWSPGVIDRVTGKQLYVGGGGDESVRMLTDRTTGRLSSLQFTSGFAPIRSIDISVRALPVPPGPDWGLDTANRVRVDSLADLMPIAEQVRIGEKFPTSMTLLSTGLSPWQEVRDDIASVLVFVPVDTAGLESTDTAEKDAAMTRLQKETGGAVRLVRNLEKGAAGHWISRNVAILPPGSNKLEITSIIMNLLNPTDSAVISEPENMPLIAIAQTFDYDPLLGGGQGGVVIIDKARMVRGIVTVSDIASTEKRVREILDGLK